MFTFERRLALATLLPGLGFGGLMFVREELGIHFTDNALLFIGALSIACLVISVLLWAHIAWIWLRKRGVKVEPIIMMFAGAALFLNGLVWALVTIAPSTVIAKETAAVLPAEPASPIIEPAEAADAKATVLKIWNKWLNSRDGVTDDELNRLVLPPDDWMNAELAKLTDPPVSYRVRKNGRSFDIVWPNASQKGAPTGTQSPPDTEPKK